MELIYLWLDKASPLFRKSEFNFSGQVFIEYNQATKKLSFKELENPTPLSFWGDYISSITGIVGKNGAGKTSLLDFIRVTLTTNNTNKIKHQHAIAVFKVGAEYQPFEFLYSSNDDKSSITWDENEPYLLECELINREPHFLNEEDESWKPIEKLKNTHVGLVSPIFEFLDFPESSYVTNLSNGYLLTNSNDTASGLDKLQAFRFNETERIFNLLLDDKVNVIFSKFYEQSYQPPIVDVLISDIKTRPEFKNEFLVTSFQKVIEFFFGTKPPQASTTTGKSKVDLGIFNDLLKKYNNTRYTSPADDSNIYKKKLCFYRGLIISLFMELNSAIQAGYLLPDNGSQKLFQTEISFLLSKERNSSIENFENTLKVLFENINFRNGPESDFSQLIDLFTFFRESIFNDMNEKLWAKSFVEEQDRIRLSKEKAFEFFKRYKNFIVALGIGGSNKSRKTSSLDTAFLTFQWEGFSSGEKAFLNIYAKIFEINRVVVDKKTCNFLYLIIDEGELGFHPQWQREFMFKLIEFINVIFKEQQIKVQIFIATHSPLLLSDFPRNNILFLEKEGEERGEKLDKLYTTKPLEQENFQTFGANIHSILSHSFFLEKEKQNGLPGTTMGTFARKKIDDVIEWLNEVPTEEKVDKEKEYYLSIINLIDEPIIANKLREMYFKKAGDADRQKLYNKELEETKKRLKEKYKIEEDGKD